MFKNLTWPHACVFNVIAEGRIKLGAHAEADVEVIKAKQDDQPQKQDIRDTTLVTSA